MTSLLKQSLALSMSNLKSLPRRAWISASTAFSVAMVVTVLLGFLAMSNGFRTTLALAGSQDVAIALAEGAGTEFASQIDPAQLHQLEGAPGIARDPDGKPIISPELVVPVDGNEKGSGLSAAISLRGVGPMGIDTRPSLKIVDGRDFAIGATEVIVGRRLSHDFQGLEVGGELRFGTSTWKVVGIFDAGGSATESEMIADIGTVQAVFNRPNSIQSVRMKLTSPSAMSPLQSFAKDNALIDLNARSEREFLAGLAERTSNLILYFGWPLAMTMAVGAVIGTMTTMYSSVSDRKTEIATVRAIGFSRTAAFIGTWTEAMFLTVFGSLAGICFSFLVLNGWSASTVGADQTRIGFQLSLSVRAAVQAFSLALVIGAVGGGFPALSATRVPLRLALAGRD